MEAKIIMKKKGKWICLLLCLFSITYIFADKTNEINLLDNEKVKKEVSEFANSLMTNTLSGKIENARGLLRSCQYEKVKELLLPLTQSKDWQNLSDSTKITILRMLGNAILNMQDRVESTNYLIPLVELSIKAQDRYNTANAAQMLGICFDAMQNNELAAKYWNISYMFIIRY